MEEERKLKGLPPSKVKLMPFPAPPRNKQRPGHQSGGRVPKKGPIPPFKKPFFKLKDQQTSMSSINHGGQPTSSQRHPMPIPAKHNLPHLPMNNLMKDAMVNIPNAIKSLPNFMQKLISNHASFVGSGRSFTDGITLADIRSDYEEEDDVINEEHKNISSEKKSE